MQFSWNKCRHSTHKTWLVTADNGMKAWFTRKQTRGGHYSLWAILPDESRIDFCPSMDDDTVKKKIENLLDEMIYDLSTVSS